ncbi:hypothetical protein V6260_02490 [Pseudoalteromonas aliena]|uniref:hypothetical protein n=1 Tax=Pseudoalteromonas aliena TaxID=247523 RepID=UPI00311FE392
MMLLKVLAVVAITLSSSVLANQHIITANKQVYSLDNKTQTYIGNVHLSFDDKNKFQTTSNNVSFNNGNTVMEGEVVITFNNITAVTNKVTFSESDSGVLAKMDEVTFTYK